MKREFLKIGENFLKIGRLLIFFFIRKLRKEGTFYRHRRPQKLHVRERHAELPSACGEFTKRLHGTLPCNPLIERSNSGMFICTRCGCPRMFDIPCERSFETPERPRKVNNPPQVSKLTKYFNSANI